MNVAYYLIKILSYSPIVCISYDHDFHTVSKEIFDLKKINNFRFSFIYIPLGSFNLYLISFYKKFDIIKILKLDDCFEEDIENKSWKLFNTVMFMNEQDKEIIFKALELKKEEEISRNSTASSKISIYNNILLIIDSLILVKLFGIYPFLKNLVFFNTFVAFLFYLLLVLISFWLVNVNILSFGSIRVRGYDSFSFKRILEESCKDLNILKSMHYYWLNLNRYNRILVSYILNMQDYMLYTIFGFLLLVIIYNLNLYLLDHKCFYYFILFAKGGMIND